MADSGGAQYIDAPPTVTGGEAPGESNLQGGSSATSGVGGSGKNGDGPGGKKGSRGEGAGGAAGGANGGGPGGVGGIGEGREVGGIGADQVGAGKGGSPLLPILIGILLLAAGSVGVVLYRQRRGSGAGSSSVSPEAG